jgi:4-hydroxy-tetrahydrodipicolinate synthase
VISSGVHVPLVTPVDSTGVVHRQDARSLIDFLRPHVDGLVPALSTGEGGLLNHWQWQDMVAATVEYAGGLPVYAGVLSPTTTGVIEKAVRAAELGADAVVATTPYGMEVTQRQMFQHFVEICAASPIPVIVYDEVDQSGNSLDLTTLLSICALPGVVAVKDSNGELQRWSALVEANPDVVVWLGREELIGSAAAADGVLLAVANLAPELCQRWWRSKDPELAQQIVEVCQHNSLFDQTWFINVKVALRQAGHINHDAPVGQVRTL